MNWISTTQARPAEGAETLILTTDGRVYVSRFEARKVQGNDRVPFGWTGPGPFSFFGWDVLYWMPVPAKPDKWNTRIDAQWIDGVLVQRMTVDWVPEDDGGQG